MIECLEDIREEIAQINSFVSSAYRISPAHSPLALLTSHASNNLSSLWLDIEMLIRKESSTDE